MHLALGFAVAMACQCIGLTLTNRESCKAWRLQLIFLAVSLLSLIFFVIKIQ